MLGVECTMDLDENAILLLSGLGDILVYISLHEIARFELG